jgi:radical SAM superfamily enzyme
MKSNAVTELIRFHEPFDRSVIIKLRNSYQIQVGKKCPEKKTNKKRGGCEACHGLAT